MHIHVMNVFAYRYDISGRPTSFFLGGGGGFQSTVILFRTMYFLELLFQLVSDFQGV